MSTESCGVGARACKFASSENGVVGVPVYALALRRLVGQRGLALALTCVPYSITVLNEVGRVDARECCKIGEDGISSCMLALSDGRKFY